MITRMNYSSNQNLLLDKIFIGCIKDIKLVEAKKAIQKVTSQLIVSGYSKEELRECIDMLTTNNK
ncbi:hypothetical protein CS063_09905 [Sporanaerobium hydrogeniformans]|uniref:Uncharacterized protein n=1 Tax=Sporanaerobium hydrogeniformans TaxID=3072179 RepID=A0AC61DBK4_9FIRM|nr:hypothetical protein [Sporanaerobium hydrogeniformans]PHV70606.1 hypothetical protein CS063_09905 [Sporanaerobium hydrogeniformans]